MSDANSSSKSSKPIVREIAQADIGVITDLLMRGFPNPRHYWEVGLERLRTRSVPPGMPRYGYMLEVDGRPVGAILLISCVRWMGNRQELFTNLSSWYVEPGFRNYATLLYKHALAHKQTTYLNLSAATNVRPIITAFGFKRYSEGQVLAVLALARNGLKAPVRVVPADSLDESGLDEHERRLLEAQAGYGCIAICCKMDGQTRPFVFVPRIIKRFIPCAQLVYCRDITELTDVAGTVGRYLLWLGRPFVLLDANGPIPGIPGRYFPDQTPKFYKGPVVPLRGDMTETEATIFGI
jgi:hypothetical protein